MRRSCETAPAATGHAAPGRLGTPEGSVGESQRRRRVEPLSYPRLGDLADCTREPSSEVANIRLNNSWAAGQGGWLRSV